ncbi:hypothetical protein like AT4G29090 [Hibiscus trionum]|uniref:RNase H type-1 domain-containing protein n=1 Tax=Hibiscus trionum TaxID=183268 RepID=A0A9W7MNN5_HIBTR|nr:hypothetical protein like AT4G29090 [Hibiscus trionum]
MRQWWGIDTIFPVSFDAFFVIDFHSVFTGCMKMWWVASVTALLWSLWLAKNEYIFRGKCLNLAELCFLVKLQSYYWIKVDRRGEVFPESIWWTCPAQFEVSAQPKRVRVGRCWQPPLRGVLKFNTDGSARGKPGPAGFGGVMRDEDSRILGLFSGPLGVMDSNEAEVRAIAFALGLIQEREWRKGCVIIESDSQVALSWVTQSTKHPWRLWEVFLAIDQACQVAYDIQFCYVPREANGFADVLAKEGVDRISTFVACI